MARKIVALFLLSWLPLQGIAAVDMPFCQHALLGASHRHAGVETGVAHQHEVQSDARARHHHSATHSTPATGAPNPSFADLECDDCGACHLACAATIPVSLSMMLGALAYAPTPGPLQTLLEFTPQQPDPPPLA
jgi:hypothetical protein